MNQEVPVAISEHCLFWWFALGQDTKYLSQCLSPLIGSCAGSVKFWSQLNHTQRSNWRWATIQFSSGHHPTKSEIRARLMRQELWKETLKHTKAEWNKSKIPDCWQSYCFFCLFHEPTYYCYSRYLDSLRYCSRHSVCQVQVVSSLFRRDLERDWCKNDCGFDVHLHKLQNTETNLPTLYSRHHL